jgi:hypothetical protein
MMNRYKSKLLLLVCLTLCRAAVGYAVEQWDAKASARVNLRKSPSLNGEILGTIPYGHPVKILQTQGSWCKVNVSGEINGKGWVYARYLERILPEAAYPLQSLTVKNTSAAQKLESHTVEPLSDSRAEPAAVRSRQMPLPAKYQATSQKKQTALSNVLPEVINEPIDKPQIAAHRVGEPGHMRSAKLLYYRFKHEVPEITGRDFSEQAAPGDSSVSPKSTPDVNENPVAVALNSSPAVSAKPSLTDRGMASPVKKPIVSHETKDLSINPQSIGPAKIALKMVSILLYGLVLLLLYREK